MFYKVVISCFKHQKFFDETCEMCKKEYFLVKGLEEKAKQLYEKLFLYYLKTLNNEKDASSKAKSIITKQCQIRNMQPWNWI